MHPDAVITYQVSDMVLAGHSDASYISETKYRSRSGEYFFMYNNTSFPPNNGTLLVIDKIIKKVMSSSAEDELGALFVKCKEAIPSSQSLEQMVHQQPPTPMQTDNTTAHGVVTNNIPIKRLNSMDMRLHWIRCRSTQRQFQNYWRSVSTNLGAYGTKHHAEIHHRTVQPTYLTPKIQLDHLRKKTIIGRSKLRTKTAASVC